MGICHHKENTVSYFPKMHYVPSYITMGANSHRCTSKLSLLESRIKVLVLVP